MRIGDKTTHNDRLKQGKYDFSQEEIKMSSEPGASFISKIKDSLQMIMYITAITGTTLAGVIKGCGLISSDEEAKQEAVAGQEQDEAEMKAAPKPAVKPKAAVKAVPAAVNEPKAEVKNEEPAQNESAKKVSGTVQNNRSEIKKKPEPEPAKPAEPAFKPMTEKERKEFEKEKKEEMKETKKEVEQKLDEKDPAGKSSNVKKKERKKIEKDEDDFRKKMRERFKEQKESEE